MGKGSYLLHFRTNLRSFQVLSINIFKSYTAITKTVTFYELFVKVIHSCVYNGGGGGNKRMREGSGERGGGSRL